MVQWLFGVTAVVLLYGVTAQSNVTQGVNTGFSVRLMAGSGPNEGIVEVTQEGKRGPICNPYWDINDATVVCRQLGYPLATLASTGQRFESRIYDTHLEAVSCQGNEYRLDDCSRGSWVSQPCSDRDTAAVICSSIGEFSVRLMGGPSRFEGRVEVYHIHAGTQPMWGTICNDYWDIYDAQVVCRQLGYGNAKAAVDDGDRLYGMGSGPVLLESVTCYGTESTLASCLTPGWHVHNCGHNEDAGVICEYADTSYVWLSPLAVTFIVIGSLLAFCVVIGCIVCCISSVTKKKQRRTASSPEPPVSFAASNQAATVETAGASPGYSLPIQQFQPPPGYVLTTTTASGGTPGFTTITPMPPPPPYAETPNAEKS
ncbi:scavenger receptor cysteine-rich domain-containing group B protein-like [Acanthaster planci]|uniref:Scavenger receptor cysteine-rich domain-containing group B protein-like n=1 Tax=Acanthaster planci TaxID=133434 RepID=A0A8B7XXN7_ACAPL|nr:scavenger receptor cysteine-rich domain-containing group B protein-like [Acanthaster planci]